MNAELNKLNILFSAIPVFSGVFRNLFAFQSEARQISSFSAISRKIPTNAHHMSAEI
jgi:hypothetical protein